MKLVELLQIKRSTLGDRINRCGLGKTAAATLDEPPPAHGLVGIVEEAS